MIAYYNGKIGSGDDITIPLSDRSIYFGDGVYDVCIGENGITFLLDEHIARLLRSAKAIGIEHKYSHNMLCDIASSVIDRSGIEKYLLYIQMTRNAKKRKHSDTACDTVNLLITVDEFTPPRKPASLKLITVDDFRYKLCNVKTINLLPAVIASSRAEREGCDEAVLVLDGYVTECAHSNISILRNGVLQTHHDCEKILPGITKAHLLSAARDLGITVREKPFGLSELYSADEIIVTSTTKLIGIANSIDGIKVGGRDPERIRKLSEAIFAEYDNYCRL